ncbi:MAG TPA: aminotransferase class V-fold PLP-dependent enzyme, partial [Tissierellaceae bacterium]
QPDIFPDKLESGTLNAPAISAMGKSIQFINEVGLENIRKKDEELISYFIENIKDLEGVRIYNFDINKTSSVVSINIKDYQSSDIEDYLSNEYNIITRSGLHCAPMVHKSMNTLKTGMVRFSFSYFNTKDEIDLVVKAIKEIVEK